MARSTVKKKSGPSWYNDPRWIKAVNLFIGNGAENGEAAMLKGGLPKTTARKKCQLLKKHPVYLEWVKAKTKKNLITKKSLNEKLLRWSDSNIVDYFDFGDYEIGEDEYRHIRVKELASLPREITDCISEIQETSHGIKIKLVDKLAAVAKLAEINGLIAPRKNEHTGPDGEPIPIAFTFGEANLKPYVPDTKNRIAKYN